jgi:hypothetical protein
MRISRASILVSVGAAVVTCAAIACVVQQAPPASDPTTVTTSPVPTVATTATSAPAADASATLFLGGGDAASEASTDVAAVDAGSGDAAQSASTTPDAGSAAAFQACAMDSDCVSVARVGCCNNGYREAVSAKHVDAYKHSFTCPPPKPMCPMFMINDTREAECNNGTHLCELVAAEKIACGGFIKNQHHCPSGFHCQLARMPDLPGTCVK